MYIVNVFICFDREKTQIRPKRIHHDIKRISEKGWIMQNKTILVVEDNELNMKLVKGLLTMGKYSLLEAVDAETGIQLARQHLPDLILMDIQLPNMDGLEATRLIRKDPVLKDVPVVALTSYAMQGDEDKAKDSGCSGYISKPIDTRSFLETIDRYLRQNRYE